MEPIQGEGGDNMPSDDFFRKLRDIAAKVRLRAIVFFLFEHDCFGHFFMRMKLIELAWYELLLVVG